MDIKKSMLPKLDSPLRLFIQLMVTETSIYAGHTSGAGGIEQDTGCPCLYKGSRLIEEINIKLKIIHIYIF